jgi:hypothetical protein
MTIRHNLKRCLRWAEQAIWRWKGMSSKE